MRNGKYKLAAIIICFLLCAAGLLYYAKGSPKPDSKKNDKKITSVKGLVDCSVKEKHDYEQLNKKINEINNVENILYSFSSSEILLLKNNKVLLVEGDKKQLKKVKDIKDNVKITSCEGNNEYAAWIETGEIKEGYQVVNENILYLYDIKKNTVKKIDETSYVKNKNNIYNSTHDIGCNFKIKENKIFYICYEYDGYKLKDQYIKEYDIDIGNQKILYRQPFKKNNAFMYLYNFDMDYGKSYLACTIKYYGNLKGYALMVNDMTKAENSRLLAVSENEITPTIIYPYMSFQVGNDVHLYNIEMKDDAFSYKSKSSISGVKMSEKILVWDADKIYCYSLREIRYIP